MSDAFDGQLGGHDATKVDMIAIDSSVPMTSAITTVVSSFAARTVDQAIRRKGWTSSGIVDDMTPYVAHASTNSSGVATIWLTDNGLSTGNAVFSAIYDDGLIAAPLGSTSNYQVVSVVVAGNLKSVTITVNQLGSVILGLVNTTSAASGIEVKCIALGKYVG